MRDDDVAQHDGRDREQAAECQRGREAHAPDRDEAERDRRGGQRDVGSIEDLNPEHRARGQSPPPVAASEAIRQREKRGGHEYGVE